VPLVEAAIAVTGRNNLSLLRLNLLVGIWQRSWLGYSFAEWLPAVRFISATEHPSHLLEV
jgi:hypothetical protein